jgi:hypothetical protein
MSNPAAAAAAAAAAAIVGLLLPSLPCAAAMLRCSARSIDRCGSNGRGYRGQRGSRGRGDGVEGAREPGEEERHDSEGDRETCTERVRGRERGTGTGNRRQGSRKTGRARASAAERGREGGEGGSAGDRRPCTPAAWRARHCMARPPPAGFRHDPSPQTPSRSQSTPPSPALCFRLLEDLVLDPGLQPPLDLGEREGGRGAVSLHRCAPPVCSAPAFARYYRGPALVERTGTLWRPMVCL